MNNSVFLSLRSLLAVACVLYLALTTANGSTLVRGENRTCRDFADLDYALDHPGSAFFKAWSSKDFDAAQAWVESCLSSPPTSGDVQRQSLLAQRRTDLEGRGEIQRNDETLKQFRATESQDREEREAQLKAEDAVKKAQQQAHDACLRSAAYQRYLATDRVLRALDRESEAQQALEHERRVEEASGTTNLYAKRYAGEALVAAQDDLNKSWALYRQYGGDAKNPRGVPRTNGNPCN